MPCFTQAHLSTCFILSVVAADKSRRAWRRFYVQKMSLKSKFYSFL